MANSISDKRFKTSGNRAEAASTRRQLDIDLDRVIWDPAYREDIKRRLREIVPQIPQS